MRISLSACLALVLLAAATSAQTDYRLSFEPGGKLWSVEARLAVRGEDTLDFWFPLWTPGAYHVADYGRFVKQLEASDEQGAPLAVERDEDELGHFVVHPGSAKELVLRYQAESSSRAQFTNNVIDVEANRIAAAYAYVNPPSLFGFVPARAHEAVRLALQLPAGWKAATVLETDAEGRYQAPSYYRFEDSPFLFSPTLETATFEVDGKPHQVSVHGKSAADAQAIAAGCKRIVEAGAQLMNGLPYDRYHFLYGFVAEAGGSGLEHSFSTLILTGAGTSIDESEHGFWGITAHEFFHLWCAERIHVQEVHHPDLTQPLETGTLWVNEGITEYFCRHLLLHAGFYDEYELLQSYFANPGIEGMVKKQPWTEVSRATVEWAGMNDLMVFAVRMYMLGPRTIFALDMELRRATQGERGVLDLLHYLMENYVAKDRGFGEEELDDVLLAIGGQPALAFYARYIDGSELPDPAQFLEVIGYRLANGRMESLPEPSAAQLSARADYFSVTGKP